MIIYAKYNLLIRKKHDKHKGTQYLIGLFLPSNAQKEMKEQLFPNIFIHNNII